MITSLTRLTNEDSEIVPLVVNWKKKEQSHGISEKRHHELLLLRGQYREALNEFDTSRQELMDYLKEMKPESIPLDMSSDIITHLQNCIDIQKNRNARFLKDVSIAKLEHENVKSILKSVCDEIEKVENDTGINIARHALSNFRTHANIQDEIRDLRQRIDIANAEIKDAKLLEVKKKQLISDLYDQLDQRKAFHESLYERCNEYRVAAREVLESQNRLETLRSANTGIDCVIRSRVESKDLVSVNDVRNDIGFLKSEKLKSDHTIGEQIRMIAAQRYRIECLRHRLNGLTLCLKDLGLWENVQKHICESLTPSTITEFKKYTTPEEVIPSDDSVSIEALELAQLTLQKLEKNVVVRDVLVTERDHAVESLGHKVEAIIMRCEEDIHNRDYLKYEFEMEMDNERRELEIREKNVRDGLDALNLENARMKRHLLAIA